MNEPGFKNIDILYYFMYFFCFFHSFQVLNCENVFFSQEENCIDANDQVNYIR